MPITTFNDLKKELDKLNDQDKYFFRGYTADDELKPLICRTPFNCLTEESILKKFAEKYKIYASAMTMLDFLSIAQHYGLATCLLDFTTNPYVALSFATGRLNTINFNLCYIKKTDAEDATDKLQEISFSAVEDVLILSSYDPTNAGKISNVLKEYKEKLCYIRPNCSSQRMMMQDGIFFIANNENIADWEAMLKAKLTILECTFNETEMMKTKRELKARHCDLYRLMPDLPGLCNAINNDILSE